MGYTLSSPINIEDFDDVNEVFNEAYDIFCFEITNRNNRPFLFNKFIYINEHEGEYGKSKGFWHVASIGADDTKFDMDPCENDISHCKCIYMCDVLHKDNFLVEENSIPCIFRANKVIWIKEIISLANQNKNHENLKIWKWIDNKTKEKTLKIRYMDKGKDIDYILIFAIKNKNNDIYYLLKTAYPVKLKSYRRRFNKEYEKYKEGMQKK